jgi:hypothetical protein
MFVNASRPLSAVAHRTTLIEQDHRAEVGFIFILPNVEAIGFAEKFPIDRSNLIAFDVLPVLFKLDAGAFVRRSMSTNGDAFDNSARKQLKSRDRITVLRG